MKAFHFLILCFCARPCESRVAKSAKATSLTALSLLFLLPLILVHLLTGCGPNAGQNQGVQLVLSTDELEPGTTFELRFDQPMATPNRVGAESDVSPLVFEPEVTGRFLWTSTRSGVFKPDEPLALDTEYQLHLRAGLVQPDGQPAGCKLRKSLRTPPFGVASVQGPEASSNAFSNPQFSLWFNANVKASEIAARSGFLDDEGKWIQAAAHQGTESERYAYWSRGEPAKTWRQRFEEQYRASARPQPTKDDLSEQPATNEIGNLVLVTPLLPLGSGHNWRLLVNANARSTDAELVSKQKFEQAVGDVQEFTLIGTSLHHVINREPYLDLDFSKNLDPTLTNSFTNWVRISPWPAGLQARVDQQRLELSGAWQRWVNYTITVRRGLSAQESFTLGVPATFTNSVPPVDPRLYVPEFSTEQFAFGNRSFPLLAVNVGRVRVRAKLLEAETAIHALRGYQSYFGKEGPYYCRRESFHRLDYNLIPGRTVFTNELDGPKQEDVPDEIKLDWDRILAGRKTGIVFLQAERAKEAADDEPLGTEALVQLTDLGLVWKSGGGHLEAFVFSYDTGQPATNVQVRLYSDENEPLSETRTDSNGRAVLELPSQAAWLAAQAGEDLHAVPLHENNIPAWWFDVPRRWRWDEDDEARRVALFTDRDAYRPRETVNVKAILRDLTETGLSIPAGRTGLVVCADARGKQFFQTSFTLSALGSCSASIALPDGPHGEYEVMMKLDGRSYSKQIQLADFQPPAFEIKLEPKPAYGPDETFELPVSARYFFGKTLSRASLRWWVEAQDHPLQPEGFEAFEFARSYSESRWGIRSGSFAANGEARVDTNCVLRFDVPLNPQAPQPRDISLLVEVTDLNQQTLTRSATLVKHSSDFYLGIKQPEHVLAAGEALPVELAAVGANGKPWQKAVKAHLTLHHIQWQTTQVRGAGRSVAYRNEAVLTNVLEQNVEVAPPIKLQNGEKGYQGTSVSGIVPPGPGEYLLEVTGRDEAEHATAASTEFNVFEKADLAWDYRNGVELKLASDKPVYLPGETALLLLKAPFSGQAWVTVERERVLRSFFTRLEGNAPAVRVPIQASDAPNVFVSVTLIRGAAESKHQVHQPEYRVGYCQLKVEDPANQLQVELSSSVTDCRPGDPVSVAALVRDSAGLPLAGAEVTLYAVDEGVLSLTDNQVPDLLSTLLAQRKLDVESSISLPLLMPEDPDLLTFHNKGYLGGGGGEEHLRHRFLPCAFWNASLMTDADGRVTASFVAPDSLTRYRVIAVAHTARNQFGSGKSAFTVSKPLLVEPALPQFANVTDCLQARAVVQNQTDRAGNVLINLLVDDKTQCGATNLSQTLFVAAHGSATSEFPVTLAATGVAKWIWHARLLDTSSTANDHQPSFTDSVQSSFPIGNITPLLREVTLARIDSGETNLLRAVNPQLLTGSGTISITVANTRMVLLREAIQQLLHYPYGCVEQTSSSLLPWVVLRDTPALLAFTQRNPVEASTAAQAGIDRLFTMQTTSGGLAYWPGGKEPILWGSAYGGFVLALAKRAGLSVPEHEFDSLLEYLSVNLRSPTNDSLDSNAQCLALYALALAGKAQPAYHTGFYERRACLRAEDRALVALAISTADGNTNLVHELLHEDRPWRSTEDDPFDCQTRETAIRLLARVAEQANGVEAEKLFRQLQAEQKNGHWHTTQGDAWALLAAREYLRQGESGAQEARGSLVWGDSHCDFDLPSGCGVFTNGFQFDASMADRPLSLVNKLGKSLYAQITLESRLPKAASIREAHGFGLQRRYDKLNDNNEPEDFQQLRVGDRVLVTLRVAVPETAQYVAIEDPLPGCLEPLNSEFKTQQVAGKAQRATWTGQDEGDYWWSDFREIRADRVQFFCDHVAAGNYVLRYVARVRAAGAVTAPVAKVEEMYNPNRFGITEPLAITARPAE